MVNNLKLIGLHKGGGVSLNQKINFGIPMNLIIDNLKNLNSSGLKKEKENVLNDDKKYNYICEIKMEIEEGDKYKFISGMGLLCNIISKNLKVLITYNK